MAATNVSNDDMAGQDESVVRFCRQYLQLENELNFPEPRLLREESVQSAIFARLFADEATAYPPPPRYELRVLKDLMFRIEDSIEDWEQHVSSFPFCQALCGFMRTSPCGDIFLDRSCGLAPRSWPSTYSFFFLI